MPYEEGSYCPNCGLANWEGLCPHCSGECQPYDPYEESDFPQQDERY